MSPEPRTPRPDRRDFLAGAVAMGLGGLAPSARRGTVERVVLVAFAGGVRTRETLGSPGNVPNLRRLAEAGVTYPRARTSNLGHFGAQLSLFTGISEARGIRDNTRGEDATVFEYVRKDLALSPTDVWLATSGGAQQANHAYGLHPDYGAAYGATTLDGDGLFNEEFRALLGAWGRPRKRDPEEEARLARLRRAIGGAQADPAADPAALERVESYVLGELEGGTTELRGAGAADAKALRVARSLLGAFRPRLLGVLLTQADVAHRDFNAYVEIIRRNDALLGELYDAILADPELAETTAVIVLPEFGRDADLNPRRGLDHGDGSDDLNYVSIVAAGPGIRRGAVVRDEVRTIDACPTVCELLGARARHARGRRLPRLLG